MFSCSKCNDDRYIFHTCCSGYQCGCMGSVVAVSPCKDCNYSGLIKPNDDMIESMEHLEFIENK